MIVHLIFFIKIADLEIGKNKVSSSGNHLARLKQENEALKNEVELWKQKLVQVGVSHGVRQFSTSTSVKAEVPKVEEKLSDAPAVSVEPAPKKEKAAKDEKKKKETGN